MKLSRIRHFSVLVLPFLFILSAFAGELPTVSPEKVGLSYEKLAHITPAMQKFVDNEVASGRFRSEDEVVAKGIRLLRARQIHNLRKKILVGVEQLDRGDAITIEDDNELAAFFDGIADEVDRELEAE